MKIKIVTDSTADIPQEVREKFGIEMVPLKVHFGNETYLDSVTIQGDEFYKKLSEENALPTTSQPSPVEFLDMYKRLIAEDPDVVILSIHIASVLSGTYQSAVLAKSLLEGQGDITIVDSKTASYGIGMLVLAVAEAIQEGKTKEACLEKIYALRDQTQLYFLLDTLEFLRKGGRIGKAASVVGSLLNVKPILSVDNSGEVYSVDKVRGHKKALLRIVDLLKKDIGEGGGMNLVLAHSNAPELAESVGTLMKEHFDVKGLTFTTIGPVIGTHTGPGAIGIFASPA